jgi:hypothetical protein
MIAFIYFKQYEFCVRLLYHAWFQMCPAPPQKHGDLFMLKTKLGRKYALWQSNKQQELLQEEVRIQEFLDMIAPSIIKFNTDHFISCNTNQYVWAPRECDMVCIDTQSHAVFLTKCRRIACSSVAVSPLWRKRK